jgi:5-methylcytosine-specific restriction endonuclease McrA
MARVAKTCSIDGCDKRSHARGMCSSHYNRTVRHGDALAGSYFRDHSIDVCQVDGCDRRLYAKAMCSYHYNCERLAKMGRVVPKKVTYAGVRCNVEECDGQAYGLGMCKPHYQRHYRQRNSAALSLHAKTRRKRVADALKIDHTLEQFNQRMSMWGNRCWMCGGPFECLDHVKPLSRGGADCLANYRPACRSCNCSKGARWFGPSALSQFVNK